MCVAIFQGHCRSLLFSHQQQRFTRSTVTSRSNGVVCHFVAICCGSLYCPYWHGLVAAEIALHQRTFKKNSHAAWWCLQMPLTRLSLPMRISSKSLTGYESWIVLWQLLEFALSIWLSLKSHWTNDLFRWANKTRTCWRRSWCWWTGALQGARGCVGWVHLRKTVMGCHSHWGVSHKGFRQSEWLQGPL